MKEYFRVSGCSKNGRSARAAEMKRTRNGSQQDDSEPSSKQPHLDDKLTSGPGPFTTDFWLDTMKYLTSSDLWHLSCVSKPVNDFVWSLLIPNFAGGMHFAGDLSDEQVGEYLSRVDNLKSLHLDQAPNKRRNLFSQFTYLTKLSSFSCHLVPVDLELLTNLTKLAINTKTFVPPAVTALTNLKELRFTSLGEKSNQTLLDVTQHLTNLETLFFLEGSKRKELEGFLKIEEMPKLKNLCVSQKSIHDETIHLLLPFRNLTLLGPLNYEGGEDIYADGDWEVKSLEIDITALGCTEEMSKLTSLSVTTRPDAEEPPQPGQFCVLGNLSKLQTFKLNVTGLEEQEFHYPHFGELSQKLKSLELHGMLKVDEVLKNATQLEGLEDLKILNSVISSEGIALIATNFPKLRFLDLRGCDLFAVAEKEENWISADADPAKKALRDVLKPLYALTSLQCLRVWPHVEREFWREK